jgi:drug/metabolite transporter (DMT)-like permease
MFVGELFCLLVYAVRKLFANQDPGASTGVNPLLLAIPAGFDICGSSLMFVALTLCAASVYQMMRGVIVVITAFMALVFLGRKQYAHHWISLFTIVSGVAIVGLVNIMASSKEPSASGTSIAGILLLLLA